MPETATSALVRPAWALLGDFTRLLLLAVVLPVLVLAGVLLWQASASVQRQGATRLAAAADSSALELHSFLQTHIAALQVLADRRNSDGDIADLPGWDRDLGRIHRHYPAFLTLLVTDADGVVVASTPALPANGGRTSVADREYFTVPRDTGKGHVSNAFRGRGFGEAPLVAVSVPLHSEGRFAGVLEGSIPVDALVLRRGGLDEHGFELLLLDRALTVVHASPGMPHRSLDALDATPSSHDLDQVVRDGGSVLRLRGVLGDGGDAFARAASLENGWQLVLLEPRRMREAHLRRTALAMLGVLALVLAGVLAVVVAKMRRLGDSVHRLLERMQQFALDGGSSQVVPSDMPTELLPLADAMNALAARARASYEDVSLSLREQSRLREELQSVAQQLLTVQEDERRTLSRELHDDVGQSITAIKLAAASLMDEDLAATPRVRREILEEIVAVADQTVLKLRDLSLLLRPPQLDSLGLEAALRGQVAQWSRNTRLDIRLVVTPFGGRLPAAIELACFRIAQEALTNIARHAGAEEVEVAVGPVATDQGVALSLRVSDDGCGLDTRRPGGLGMLTMRERATQFGGSLSITRRPDGGTIVHALLPLPRED